MAKKKNKTTFAEMLAELKKSESSKRVVRQEEQRHYFLLVCEGEKTEPNYFNALVAHLPPESVKVEIEGEGTNTLSVVNKAIELRNKRAKDKLLPDFDEVWAVFDRDSFPAAHFNEAMLLGERQDIGTAYSNEAFELWYILHFQYLDTGVTRNRYIEILKQRLGDYAKNSDDIYEILQQTGDEKTAIKHAKRLLENAVDKTPSDAKPSTRVHILVERLNKYKA